MQTRLPLAQYGSQHGGAVDDGAFVQDRLLLVVVVAESIIVADGTAAVASASDFIGDGPVLHGATH